jgi:glycosyltransferase involved in cell wall biosynthesis
VDIPTKGLNTTMEISVIVPIYNVERQLLGACLDSVVKQTLRRQEYEVILVDDCSTDKDTISVIDAITKATPNMKLVRHTENLGLNEARHSGVKAASGDYVFFLDGDDILTRDAIENLLIKAYETGAELVTAPAFRWISGTRSYSYRYLNKNPLPVEYIARLKTVIARNYSFAMWGRLFKREVLTDDIFDLPLHLVHEDRSTFVRVLFKVRNVAHIHRPIYYYTVNEAGLTSTSYFTADHIEGQFYAFNDWIENVKRHGVFEELSSALPYSFEKRVHILVWRCLSCQSLDDDDKVKMLNIINEKYRALPVQLPKPSWPGTKLLQHLQADSIAGRPARLQEAIKQSFPDVVPKQPTNKTRLQHSLVPTEIARQLKDRVVFICQVDYNLRNAVTLASELGLRGHSCVILDNSAFVAGGRRQLPPQENNIFQSAERIQIARPPYDPDWLSTAKLVITFIDSTDVFREALEYRHRLGLPSVCIIEGINDFLRVDFQGYRHLPYRRCDYVFLAGSDDKKYFEDRQIYIVGLPVIESLAARVPTFPEKPLAVLNVNFTYGALEEAREQFIAKAKNAFAAAGYNWVITKHPMDKGGLKDYPVSNLTQYELIDRCSVFVSRFATGILEALASGKPAIYFNPHNEKVEKFKSPLGAYEIATTEEELIRALQNVAKDIESGVDFRARALPFLEWHTGYRPDGPSVTHRFSEAVTEILERDCEQQSAVADLFLQRLQEQEPFRCESPGIIIGDFDRRHKAQLPEEELIARYFGNRGSIMIDVGAGIGNSLGIFLGKGWKVHTLEPGAGKTQADMTTLGYYYLQTEINHVDVLRVEGKGFGLSVLDGVPWERDKPEVVLVKFEDAKTAPPGCSAHELAGTLIRRGYTVYVSEWLPAVRSGVTPAWRRLIRYSPELELDTTRCNTIGFLEDPGEEKLRSLVQQTMKFSARPDMKKVSPAVPKFWSAPGQWYLHMGCRLAEHITWRYPRLADYVMRRHPRLVMMYQRLRH